MPFNVDDLTSGTEAPRYNVAPGTHVPVLLRREEASGVTLEELWWGYHPHWAGKDAPTPINAKAEGVASSRYYANAFSRHRCVVPADGWYEWLNVNGRKQPHFICREDRQLIWLAGIWSTRPDGEPGLALITHDARGPAREVHSRMPLALDDGCLADWLDPQITQRDTIRTLSRPVPADRITHWPVSTEVNRVGNDHAELVAPINPA